MTTDKLKGKAKDVVGSGKEKLGRATDNEDMEAEGKADKLEGKGQQVIGEAKERAKRIKDKVT